MRNIFVALLALLWCACKTGKNYLPVNSADDISRNLAPTDQEFTVHAGEDNIVKGEKGTRVFIPAGSLVFEDGTPVKGDAVITLREFYSSGDMISANLESRCDSQVLQTGGMLYVTAETGGKKLKIDDSKSLAIAFPRKKGIDSMEIFYGSHTNNGINWMPGMTRKPVPEQPDTLMMKDSTLYTEKPTVCGFLASSGRGDVEWILKHKDSTIFLYVYNHLQLPADEWREFCATRPDAMALSINKKGRVTNVEFYQGDGYTEYKPPKMSAKTRRSITNFLKTLPDFDMRSMPNDDPTYYLQFCCAKQIDREKYAAAFRNKYDRYRDKAVTAMDATEMEFYVLSATQLGWINCDRFLNYEGEKADFVIELPGVKDPKVQLMFPDISAVMQGEVKNGRAVFTNVPVGKRVAITAIAFGGKEQPLLAKADAVTGKQVFKLPPFQPFTMQDLDAALNMK